MATVIAPAAAVAADRRRYPGVRSFEEEDQGRFFGRTRATEELLLRVLSVRLLLQFAPSGVGKTSLLNAGLFPRLRHHNLFPVMVRLNQPAESLTDAVRRSLKESAHDRGLVDPVIPDHAERLWDLLAGVQLWSRDLLLLTPVLVFDQFEEVFTLRDESFRELFGREIGALSLGRAPDVAAHPVDGRGPSPDVKIILSLREEYLGKLEEFSTRIPDLFQERLRLSPLTADEAKEAIVAPAKLPGDHWLSPVFEFTEACLDALIDFIDGASETVKVIEPLTLQLVCQRAEVLAAEHAAREGGYPILNVEDFGGAAGLESLVENFYRSELQKLPGARTQAWARRMFEEGLLDPSGKRLMLEEGQIKRRYRLDTVTLDALVGSRLLRREPRNESVFYEISHDRLTDVIAKNRKASLPRWVIPTMVAGGAVMLIIIIAVVFAVVMAVRANEARGEVEKALGVLLNEDLVGRLREVGLTDALAHVLDDADVDLRSKGKARALSLRHEGDIAIERRTIADARGKFQQALEALDDVAAKDGGAREELLAERARILERLGSVAEDAGLVSDAAKYYGQAADVWRQRVKTSGASEELLEASEALMSLGRIQGRIGEPDRAQETYTEALRLALRVLTNSIEHTSRDHADYVYDQGRAMQIYADAASHRAAGEPELRAALLLARESLRLRPLSSSARGQVAYAAATYGAAVLSTANARTGEQLLLDATKQFEELTRWDPDHRRMQRESAATHLLSPQGAADCAEKPACGHTLDRRTLDEAQAASLAATGQFRELAAMDPENRSLQQDVGWGQIVHGRILYALGRREEGLERLDEAIAAYRAAVADPQDIDSRLAIAVVLRQKAALLATTNPAQALGILDAALAEVATVPPRLIAVQWERQNIATARVEPLKALGRGAEAKRIEADQQQSGDRLSDPWSAKEKLAREKNEEGVRLNDAAAKLSGSAALPGFQRALDAFKAASTEYPFEFVYWNNQVNAYQWIRKIQEDLVAAAEPTNSATGGDTSSAASSALAEQLEATLRGTLTATWMARVLSDEKHTADLWKAVYEARRGLVQFLRRHNRNAEAMAQFTLGVPAAEEYGRLKHDSADALSLLSDANAGLGILRWETKKDGWEEALRTAVEYRERLGRLQPRDASHQTWTGQFRQMLGDHLKENHRERAAAPEYKLAVQACREGLRLATNTADRDKAQGCLTELAAQGYR